MEAYNRLGQTQPPVPYATSGAHESPTQSGKTSSVSLKDTLKEGASLAWDKLWRKEPSAENRGPKAATDAAPGDQAKTAPTDSDGQSGPAGPAAAAANSPAVALPHYEKIKTQADQYVTGKYSKDWKSIPQARGDYADMMYRGAQSAGDGKGAYLEAFKKDREAMNQELNKSWQADQKGALGTPAYLAARKDLDETFKAARPPEPSIWNLFSSQKSESKAYDRFFKAQRNYIGILGKADISASSRNTLLQDVGRMNATVQQESHINTDAQMDAISGVTGVAGIGRDAATFSASAIGTYLAKGNKSATGVTGGAAAGAAMDLAHANALGLARWKNGASLSDNLGDYLQGAGKYYENQKVPSSVVGAGIGLALANVPAQAQVGAGAFFTGLSLAGTRQAFKDSGTLHEQQGRLQNFLTEASDQRKALGDAFDQATRKGEVARAQELKENIGKLDSDLASLQDQIGRQDVAVKESDNSKWLQAAEAAFAAAGTGFGLRGMRARPPAGKVLPKPEGIPPEGPLPTEVGNGPANGEGIPAPKMPGESSPTDPALAGNTPHDNAISAAKANLDSRKISYTAAQDKDGASYLRINPDKDTGLGRIAARLAIKNDGKIVYHPGEIDEVTKGSYDPKTNTINLPEYQMKFPSSLNEVTVHELAHFGIKNNPKAKMGGVAYGEALPQRPCPESCGNSPRNLVAGI